MIPIPYDVKQKMDDHGIVYDSARGLYEPQDLAMPFSVACDAQPTMVTVNNSGIPSFLLNWLDPEMIRVLVAPMKATKIVGETKKGDWTTQTAMFPLVESTGEVSSYGDWNTNGSVNSNVNWENRASYLFQTITQWGELELARAGEGKINYAASLNIASALTLNKFRNKSYFFGISGLANYGLLNDPSLNAAITPATKAATGVLWSSATAAEVYTDIESLYGQLVSQTAGIVEMDTPMVLAMSPAIAVNLTKTNIYNVNVFDQLKKNFPNMRVETAVEYATTAGQLVQLIADKLEGQDTAYCAFNEKMRSHAIVIAESSFKQKKTAGTWGCIIRMPAAIAQMLGV